MGPHREDFATRKNKLAGLSDQELEEYFWRLAGEIVDPLVEFARTHTTPSIERSVLLRMGFSSLEAQEIVARANGLGLLGKGAGHILLRLAAAKGMDLKTTGVAFKDGGLSEEALAVFGRE